MDIQINAAQGRGKSTLARAIANTVGGQIYEAHGFEGANINLTKISRDIVEARADVVIFDGAADWSVQHLKGAVQAARQSLRRNILAIYCVQDHEASVNNSTQAFIPFGFVNAADAFARMDDRPRNTFKDNGRNTFKGERYAAGGAALDVQALDPEQAADLFERYAAAHVNVIRVHDEIVVDGITEQSIGDLSAKSYTADELLAMARLIHDHGNQTAIDELRGVYKHFGVEGVAVLPPIFHATAHALILPMWQAVVAGLRNKCRDIVKSHMTGAVVPQSLRTIVQEYGINVADVDAKHLPELYEKLQQYGK